MQPSIEAEGIHYYKTHRSEALAILKKYLETDDAEALVETYEVMGLTLLPEKPYPTLRGIQTMLQRLAGKKKYQKAKTAKPERFVAMAFVKELDSSGFIDRLYKSVPVVKTLEKPGPSPLLVEERISPVEEETTKLASKPAVPASEDEVQPLPAVAERVAAPSVTPGIGQEYTIQAGDTLSKIADLFYGAEWKWRSIYGANTQTVKDPNLIFTGKKLIIPPDDPPPTS